MPNCRRGKRSRATAVKETDKFALRSSGNCRRKTWSSSHELGSNPGATSGSVDVGAPTAGIHMACSVYTAPPRDPVVTHCGHLFRWPCLYCSLRLRSGGGGECPVCRHRVSPDSDSVTPIYGSYGKADADPAVPQRPHSLSEEVRIRTEERDELWIKLAISYGRLLEGLNRSLSAVNSSAVEGETG